MVAKVIQISNDGGSNWNNLPGSEGSFNSEADSVDDTILGQTYASTDVALQGWGVSANAIWKGFSGYLAELKKVGTPVAFTAESMTLVSGKTYAIDDATKDIWDRSEATMDILDTGGSIAAADILNIDYLFGRVTFVSAFTPSGAVTCTGKSFPVAAAGKAKTYNLTMTADPIDETDYTLAQANSGTKVFKPGLRTVALELGGIFDASEAFAADLLARAEIIIEIDPAGDGSSIARGFFKLVTTDQGGAVGALEEETVNFALTVPDETTNPIVEFPFNWRHTNTTLNQAIQDLMTSFISELNTYDVQYLPQGAIGQSPNDGKKGDFMVADMSLSGGLDAMNVFQAQLLGTGEYTVV